MSIFGIFKKNNSNEEIEPTYTETSTSDNEDGLDLTDDVQNDYTRTEEHDNDDTPSNLTDSNNDVDDSNPEVDKISGHNSNNVRYFMDKSTDLA